MGTEKDILGQYRTNSRVYLHDIICNQNEQNVRYIDTKQK